MLEKLMLFLQNMRYKIAYSQATLLDLINIQTYLEQYNSSAISRVFVDIERHIAQIVQFPHLGISVADLTARFRITQKFRYRIVYEIKGQTIYLLRVLHPRQAG